MRNTISDMRKVRLSNTCLGEVIADVLKSGLGVLVPESREVSEHEEVGEEGY